MSEDVPTETYRPKRVPERAPVPIGQASILSLLDPRIAQQVQAVMTELQVGEQEALTIVSERIPAEVAQAVPGGPIAQKVAATGIPLANVPLMDQINALSQEVPPPILNATPQNWYSKLAPEGQALVDKILGAAGYALYLVEGATDIAGSVGTSFFQLPTGETIEIPYAPGGQFGRYQLVPIITGQPGTLPISGEVVIGQAVDVTIENVASGVTIGVTGEVDATIQNSSLNVTILDTPIDVTVENSNLDVTIQNSSIDVTIQGTADVSIQNASIDVASSVVSNGGDTIPNETGGSFTASSQNYVIYTVPSGRKFRLMGVAAQVRVVQSTGNAVAVSEFAIQIYRLGRGTIPSFFWTALGDSTSHVLASNQSWLYWAEAEPLSTPNNSYDGGGSGSPQGMTFAQLTEQDYYLWPGDLINLYAAFSSVIGSGYYLEGYPIGDEEPL